MTNSYWYEHDNDGEIKKPGTLEDGYFIEWGDLLQLDNLQASSMESPKHK